MTDEQLMFYKSILLKLKKSIEEAINVKYSIEMDNEKFKDDNEESEEGDIAAKLDDINFQEKKMQLYKNKLKEIETALYKIEMKTYGICEESGEEIDEKRLMVNPTVKYSIEMQRLFERGH